MDKMKVRCLEAPKWNTGTFICDAYEAVAEKKLRGSTQERKDMLLGII